MHFEKIVMIDIILIIKATEKDEFSRGIELYIRTVLEGQIYEKVDNFSLR